ncbi:MAG: metalloenzyme [Chloroflexi bacterium]|nr:metalloenzyme [Chloroflexota bacterium]
MLLFIFLDGVGLGPNHPSNPFAKTRYPALERLCGGPLTAEHEIDRADHLFRGIDACLGVEGLPQSATGQTTLFTGVNGPQLEGMHISAFPTRALRDTIAKHSFLKKAKESGFRVTFANAYSPYYWTRANRRNRHSATTWANMAAGLRFRDFDDLARGRAVYWDITHELARASYAPELPYVAPERAGQRLARLAARHDLTLWETFLPDLCGHRRIAWSPVETLQRIDAMLGGLLETLPPQATLLITSDHGNLEDPSTKGHTYNPAPLIVWGPGARHFRQVNDLTGIAPAILECLRHGRPSADSDENGLRRST